MLNEYYPNNLYNEFLRTFLSFYNEAFLKQIIQIKGKSFSSLWMTKCLVKSLNKKQRLYENFSKNRNPEKELYYEQYKTLFEYLKNKSKKNYYSDLFDSYKYNIKKSWDVIKEIIGHKRVTNAPLSIFIMVKNREIFGKKKKLGKRLIIILFISVPSWLPPFPSNTIFTTMVLCSVPLILWT